MAARVEGSRVSGEWNRPAGVSERKRMAACAFGIAPLAPPKALAPISSPRRTTGEASWPIRRTSARRSRFPNHAETYSRF
jgi:hypothetical protein